MTWSKVCSWNEYRNPWKFNDRMYMYIYYLLLLELLYIIYLTWTKHNLKIVIQGRTNLLLVLKNECVTMRESLIICKEYCLWQDLNFESQRYWEGCQENKHSVICDFRHHVSFIVIMNKVSLNYVQTACIFKYHVWNGTQKKIGFFFYVKVYFSCVWHFNSKNPFFNLKLWLTF